MFVVLAQRFRAWKRLPTTGIGTTTEVVIQTIDMCD